MPKFIYYICQPNKLQRQIRKKMGGQPKNCGEHSPPVRITIGYALVYGFLCYVALPCIPAVVVTFLFTRSSAFYGTWGTWLLNLTSSPLYGNVM